jgi:hypothetical protein
LTGIATQWKFLYFDILRSLGDAARSKFLPKWRTNSFFLLHNNAPAHQSGLVDDFLAKNNVATLENHPYTPYLAAADCFLFPPLKLALKGRCMCNDTEVIKNAKEELKRRSKKSSRNVSNTFL